MQLFLDTADIGEIAALVPTGLVDGITTNPTLIAESGQPFIPTIEKICGLVTGPVSAEVVATDYDGMIREATILRQIASNIVIKLPLTVDGLRACQQLTRENVKTNVTLCFSAAQALAAMKSGATYLSPFLGRFEQNGGDATGLLNDIITIKRNYGFNTKILAASIRSVGGLITAAKAGADCATLKLDVFHALVKHDLTDAGLAAFLSAWEKTGQKIV
jgi:transaldolase